MTLGLNDELILGELMARAPRGAGSAVAKIVETPTPAPRDAPRVNLTTPELPKKNGKLLQNPEGNFHIYDATTVPLTRELAHEFAEMEASKTERELSPKRYTLLHNKAELHQLVTFKWDVAIFEGKKVRVNGQTSSRMLLDLPDELFPEGNYVHLTTYTADSVEGLTELFQQFDAPFSVRNPADIAGIIQGIQVHITVAIPFFQQYLSLFRYQDGPIEPVHLIISLHQFIQFQRS